MGSGGEDAGQRGVPGVHGGLPGGGGTGVGQGAAEGRGGSVCTPLPASSTCRIPVSGSTHGARPAQGMGRGTRGGVRCGRGVGRGELSTGRHRPCGREGGSVAHSLVSQSSPSQPLGQKQRKASTSSMQVPPLRHGWPRQSSMSAGGECEMGPQVARPPPGPGPRLLTLVAVGAREAAVADTGEVAPGLADAVSVGAAHARGAHASHPGPCLKPAAIDHCRRDKRGSALPLQDTATPRHSPTPSGPAHTAPIPLGPAPAAHRPAGPAHRTHHCRPRPQCTHLYKSRPLHPFLQTPPTAPTPAGPAHRTHPCRPRQDRAPGAQSNSCRPCHPGRRSSSPPPGCSTGPRSGRGLAHRSRCPPAGWGQP